MTNYIYIWFDQLAKSHYILAGFTLSVLVAAAISIVMTELHKKKRTIPAICTLIIGYIVASLVIAIIMSNYTIKS